MYAFGVLLWEMLTGGRAWDGLTPAQVMLAVALNQQRLSYPITSPPDLTRCVPCRLRSPPLHGMVTALVRQLAACCNSAMGVAGVRCGALKIAFAALTASTADSRLALSNAVPATCLLCAAC